VKFCTLWSLWALSGVIFICFMHPFCVEYLLCAFLLYRGPLVKCPPLVSCVEFLYRDSENPSRGEDGVVEQAARISKQISRVCVWFSLNSTLLLFISCIAIIAHSYMHDIVYVLILVLIQESYWNTSTLIKEES